MFYPHSHPILSNFDTSVILPFYRKLEDFRRILPLNAKHFQRNGIEVIIVMDEPTEQEGVIDFVKQFPLINWLIIVNDQPHSWRNPSKAINVGIKAATKEYIMICSPESQFHTDAIFRLRYAAENFNPCFAIGKVVFGNYNSDNKAEFLRALPYGSTLLKREYLMQIGGYSEFFDQWGGEDDNLRAKLEYAGIKKLYVDDAILIHHEEDNDGFDDRAAKSRKLPEEIIHRSFYPIKQDFINPRWGTDFSKVIYNYGNNIHSESLCKTYLKDFKRYEISRKDTFTEKFKIVAIIQTYNEKHHMPEVLQHLDNICDGVIMIDDDSTDGTFELAESEKLLMKVQKSRTEFNDIENRNILLDLASFIKCDWLFFIDADERLLLWNSKLEDIISDDDIAYCFYLVHLWDSENTYRTDVPEQSPIRLPGVLHRWRLFKKLGRSQILSNSKLHFQSTPYIPRTKVILPALIVHYGMLTHNIRKSKYQNYLKEDLPEKHENYRYFLDEVVNLARLEDLNKLEVKTFL